VEGSWREGQLLSEVSTIRMCLDAGYFQIKFSHIRIQASVSVLFGTMENVEVRKS